MSQKIKCDQRELCLAGVSMANNISLIKKNLKAEMKIQ